MPKGQRVGIIVVALLASTFWLRVAGQTDGAVKGQAPDTVKKAICVIHGLGSNHKIAGVVTFTQTGDEVKIMGKITGLSPGKHGFHVHEFGDCSSPDGLSAGGHFDTDKHNHGGPHSTDRHTGDLGNIEADENGLAVIQKTDKVISLSGHNSIIGRAIIVHAKTDDLKDIKSAGARIGCGVIGIGKP